MSRSGYSDDCDGWSLIMYRGAVASATKGRRGQRLLRELLAAIDAMPDKRLIANDLEASGEVCALGALGRQRRLDMSGLDPEDAKYCAKVFGIAPALLREIVYENDEFYRETPEHRYTRMREWVDSQIIKEPK